MGWQSRLTALRGSLFLRLVLLVIFTVLASQLFTWWLVTRQQHELIAQQFYTQALSALSYLEERLAVLPLDKQAAFLKTYNHPRLPQLLPASADQGLTFSRQYLPVESLLVDKLSATFKGAPIKVRHLPQQEEVWLRWQQGKQSYWFCMLLPHFRDDVADSRALGAVLASVCALFIASLLAWRISMPISQVAHAANELALGRTPKPVVENRGPHEVRDLTMRFNRMVQALDSLERDRRLMLAGLSHDLRTPLTRLKLTLELQEEAPDKANMLEDIAEMNHIVGQFIDFVRSEEKQRREYLSLTELISQLGARYQRIEPQLALNIATDVELVADPVALERLLNNLLDNARRYGAPPFALTLHSSKEKVDIAVIDHGTGIPPALQEAALTPFERLAPHRGVDGGSGLGLAIVARIVKQHGGELTFYQTKEGGFAVGVRLGNQ